MIFISNKIKDKNKIRIMLTYLKLFDLHTEYVDYLNGGSMILPNVSYCQDIKDVHYNPTSIKVSGKFTVPSRLFDVVQDGGGSGPEPGPQLHAVNPNSRRSNIQSLCYGLADGIRQGGNEVITFNDANHTQIYNMTFNVIYDSVIDSVDGEEYKYVSFPYMYLPVDENGDTIEESDYSELHYNEETGQEELYHYLYSFNNNRMTGRINSDNVLETGSYEEEYDSQTGSTHFVFYPRESPKSMGVLHNANIMYWDNNTNSVVYKTIDNINTICYYKDDVYWYINEDDEYLYDGDYTFIADETYSNLLIPVEILKSKYDINDIDIKWLFKSILIDDNEIDIDELIDNNGWYELEEGVHTVFYKLDNSALGRGYLKTGLFTSVPIEELVLDRRIKGSIVEIETISSEWGSTSVFVNTPFDGCALLGTDEETINRVCKNVKLKPLVFECEFEDDDDYLINLNSNNTMVSGATYFAIHDDVVGMHVCCGSPGGGGSGGGEIVA